MNVLIVYGTASPPGRLFTALAGLRARIAERSDAMDASLLDLSANALDACDGRPDDDYSEATRSAVEAAGAADAVVLATPVYRGTYTGVLKNYLDLLPVSALLGKPVGIVAMGASDHHYLGVDAPMRQVLSWFGALTAPTAVYLIGRSFGERRELSEAASNELDALVETLLVLAAADVSNGPRPLSARGR